METKLSPESQAMKLPAGEVCDNCFAFTFCAGIGCTWSGRTECDYYPRRFLKAQPNVHHYEKNYGKTLEQKPQPELEGATAGAGRAVQTLPGSKAIGRNPITQTKLLLSPFFCVCCVPPTHRTHTCIRFPLLLSRFPRIKLTLVRVCVFPISLFRFHGAPNFGILRLKFPD